MQQAEDRLGEELPPLAATAALAEADRCLYCYDAPCTQACPTHIDVPAFIKKIATGNLRGSAETILAANLLGATCARVCPVQELCEGACVLGAEHQPIAIGRLQRYAMDYAAEHEVMPAPAATPCPGRVAVVGAGPAGLSCAGELARRGHAVTIFEKRELPGGLSTYGIISLREPISVAVAEAERIARLGVSIETGRELGADLSYADLKAGFDAVVLSIGLGRTPVLGIPGEEHILDGLEYIEQSKTDPAGLPRAASVIVVGAGNTAIDCATVARRTGASTVTMVYRRSEREMTCYEHEYGFARGEGIAFRFLAAPVAVHHDRGRLAGLHCVGMKLEEADSSGRPAPRALPGTEFLLPADLVIKAIGQQRPALALRLGLATRGGFLAVSDDFETSDAGTFAIGDCIRAAGAASTVMAVEDGKLAAEVIHRRLSAQGQQPAGADHGRP